MADNEPMTGWDNPEDFDTALTQRPESLGRQLLKTLATYINYHNTTPRDAPNCLRALEDLEAAMRQIDWNAIEFTLDALARGEQIFSAHQTQDVLLRYEPHTT